MSHGGHFSDNSGFLYSLLADGSVSSQPHPQQKSMVGALLSTSGSHSDNDRDEKSCEGPHPILGV